MDAETFGEVEVKMEREEKVGKQSNSLLL